MNWQVSFWKDKSQDSLSWHDNFRTKFLFFEFDDFILLFIDYFVLDWIQNGINKKRELRFWMSFVEDWEEMMIYCQILRNVRGFNLIFDITWINVELTRRTLNVISFDLIAWIGVSFVRRRMMRLRDEMHHYWRKSDLLMWLRLRMHCTFLIYHRKKIILFFPSPISFNICFWSDNHRYTDWHQLLIWYLFRYQGIDQYESIH
jgi:hypothetical protein